MMSDNALAKLDQATRMLAEIRTVKDAKKVVDLAESARYFASKVKLGLRAQNHAAEIKLRAEREGGRILREMKERGERHSGSGNNVKVLESHHAIPKLEDFGISLSTSSRWQQIEALPQEKFDSIITESDEAEKELTSNAVLREAKTYAREKHHEDLKTQEIPDNKFRVFYADPPWRYNDSGVISESDNYGRAERHYPTMPLDSICALGELVKQMAEDNAVLFMWVTSPLLEDGFKVIKAWGFEYKTSFVWDKVKHNFGHYNSVRHEFLLICTRGSCTPDNLKLIDSVQTIERSDKHSEKPSEFYGIIETLYTHGNKIEFFARSKREGWESWGNEDATTN